MELHGIGVGRGVAVGTVRTMARPPAPSEAVTGGGVTRVREAIAMVAADLDRRAAASSGVARDIVATAARMARDPELDRDIATRILAGAGAEHAVVEAVGEVAGRLIALGGELAERATDLSDVGDRIVAQLRGAPMPGIPDSATPFVLFARDLAPADAVLLDPVLVLGVAFREGGPTSHTATIARAKGIPAVVALDGDLADGDTVLLNARTGVVVTDPTAEQQAAAVPSPAVPTSTAPGALADGTRIALLATLDEVDSAGAALALGAEGIGLLRTEMLFLGSTTMPSIAEQRERYVEVLRASEGRPVAVRTFDPAIDKPLAFLPTTAEPNPALGRRGLRSLLADPAVLHDQLQALAEAQSATGADLRVMASMVADAVETRTFVDAARAHGLEAVGVMAEIPSLALTADRVFEIADFVSVGTNDLTQHTLAADRAVAATALYQDPWHPAVLRLVRMLGDAAAAAGKPLSVCGEAAADPELAIVLVGLGAGSLSMAPPALAEVRAALAGVTREEARQRAHAALTAGSATDARAAARGTPRKGGEQRRDTAS